ncbi:MAG: glycosyltransferase family 4 protein [Chloroflexi bacterium]|nr:glycosyltransferase family 4 protein [Chloroflexota bacterium]
MVICAAQVPFVRGGAEELVAGLRQALAARGYAVEVVALPFKWYPPQAVLTHALAWRLLDLTEANGRPIDLVIATKYPSYLVKHPNKMTWLVHQFRQAYDLYGTPYGDLTDAPEHRRVREAVIHMDTMALGESRRRFTISANVGERLARYNGLSSTTLYPPPRLDGRYRSGEFGDYVFTIGRLETIKRVDLLIQAMCAVPSGIRCVIAGAGPDRSRLEALAGELGVADRVTFLGYVDDAAVVDLYAGCLAAYYAPYDEDYGYVTVEAFKSGKPVVTARDAGGVLEFVRDGETGRVVDPEPACIAEAIGQLAVRRRQAQEMGAAGAALVRDITWDRTLEVLLAP